jgi:hypothetical protein
MVQALDAFKITSCGVCGFDYCEMHGKFAKQYRFAFVRTLPPVGKSAVDKSLCPAVDQRKGVRLESSKSELKCGRLSLVATDL